MSNYLLIYLLIDLLRDYLLMQQMPSNKDKFRLTVITVSLWVVDGVDHTWLALIWLGCSNTALSINSVTNGGFFIPV